MCNASTMWIPHCASIFQVANTPKKYPTISVREQQNILAGCPVFKLSCRRTDEQLFIHPCRLHREAFFGKVVSPDIESSHEEHFNFKWICIYIYLQATLKVILVEPTFSVTFSDSSAAFCPARLVNFQPTSAILPPTPEALRPKLMWQH